MKIIIYWDNENSQKLFELTKESLDSIWLTDFVPLINEKSTDFAEELKLSKDYAFCVEEESIEFKDMIFEWQIPDKKELDSLIISIIWWSPHSSCEDWCWTCGWWCGI